MKVPLRIRPIHLDGSSHRFRWSFTVNRSMLAKERPECHTREGLIKCLPSGRDREGNDRGSYTQAVLSGQRANETRVRRPRRICCQALRLAETSANIETESGGFVSSAGTLSRTSLAKPPHLPFSPPNTKAAATVDPLAVTGACSMRHNQRKPRSAGPSLPDT
jgi:hypothetical protein